jgi:hypothetical protein
MEDELDQMIDSYYEDSVELKDNKFLIFKRVNDYRQTDRKAAMVYLEDRTLGTVIELGTYFDASWRFLTPITEKLFWSTVKAYQKESKEIFNKIRSNVPPSRNLLVYQIQFSRLKKGSSETLNKLRSIFRGEIQDDNY